MIGKPLLKTETGGMIRPFHFYCPTVFTHKGFISVFFEVLHVVFAIDNN